MNETAPEARRSVGRPRHPQGRRLIPVMTYLEPEEMERVRQAATAQRIPIAAVVRNALYRLWAETETK